MAIDVVLEGASEDMEFATVNRWYAKEGERVTAADPLVEIEADKASYDIEAPASGVLVEILAEVGDEVPVGAALARIEDA
jgi:pyruvate/2-oxoglutarate dehydrogenase complex dihydrolipoamide acyltransferase (E2) component